MQRHRVYSENDFGAWPNCSVPDCGAKVFCEGGSDKCYPHTFYMTQAEIRDKTSLSPAEWQARHAMLVERKRQMESAPVPA